MYGRIRKKFTFHTNWIFQIIVVYKVSFFFANFESLFRPVDALLTPLTRALFTKKSCNTLKLNFFFKYFFFTNFHWKYNFWDPVRINNDTFSHPLLPMVGFSLSLRMRTNEMRLIMYLVITQTRIRCMFCITIVYVCVCVLPSYTHAGLTRRDSRLRAGIFL